MEVAASSVVLLPYTPSSVAVARSRLIADLMSAGIFETAVGDAALVVSELLSNALRHASPLPGAMVRVAWVLDGSALQVAVSDGGGLTIPRRTQASHSAVGGRGLGIVENLSRRWGIRSDERETTVWAVLSAPHANGSSVGRVPSVS
jgi:anti-sigma regulatory factor (Ser/Thr protein kinase)